MTIAELISRILTEQGIVVGMLVLVLAGFVWVSRALLKEKDARLDDMRDQQRISFE